MPALIRYATLPVAAFLLIGLGLGAGVSHAQDAPPASLARGMAHMMQSPGMEHMMESPGMDRMMRRMP